MCGYRTMIEKTSFGNLPLSFAVAAPVISSPMIGAQFTWLPASTPVIAAPIGPRGASKEHQWNQKQQEIFSFHHILTKVQA